MSILTELASVVKRQRLDIGISQERLAEIAGLSRGTINELETGKLRNLSLLRAERLANELGLGIGIIGVKRSRTSDTGILETAARAASVSYGKTIPVETLQKALLTGVVAPDYIPQLRAFLDEVSLKVISAVTAELARENETTSRAIWLKLRQLAVALACSRSIWN